MHVAYAWWQQVCRLGVARSSSTNETRRSSGDAAEFNFCAAAAAVVGPDGGQRLYVASAPAAASHGRRSGLVWELSHQLSHPLSHPPDLAGSAPTDAGTISSTMEAGVLTTSASHHTASHAEGDLPALASSTTMASQRHDASAPHLVKSAQEGHTNGASEGPSEEAGGGCGAEWAAKLFNARRAFKVSGQSGTNSQSAHNRRGSTTPVRPF
eukprot:1180689-Prorocentrum_minimum.AAC.2